MPDFTGPVDPSPSSTLYSDSGVYSTEAPFVGDTATTAAVGDIAPISPDISTPALGTVAPISDDISTPALGTAASAVDAVIEASEELAEEFTFSEDILFDERLVLLPDLTGRPPMVFIQGDKISDSAVGDGTIITSIFVGGGSQLVEGSVYGFEEKSTLDPAEFATLLDDAGSLTGSVSINALQLTSYAVDPTSFTPVMKNVDIYYTAGPNPPKLNSTQIDASLYYWTYGISMNPFSYTTAFGGFFEKKALVSKYGYDAITYNPEPYAGTTERLTDSMNRIVDDLSKGVLQRLDISKTTKKLDLNKELFEEITTDESLEGIVASTSAPTETQVTTTVPTSSPRTGGSY